MSTYKTASCWETFCEHWLTNLLTRARPIRITFKIEVTLSGMTATRKQRTLMTCFLMVSCYEKEMSQEA